MIRVEPHRLWLGHAGDARDVRQNLGTGILAVVQLALEEAPAGFPRDLIHLRIPLLDGVGNSRATLQLAVNGVAHLVAAGIPTLVFCGAGMSRTPAIAACAIAQVEGRQPAEVLASVQTRTSTDVSPGLWRDLLAVVA